jgi:Na+/H+ antiporter NhaD/arsenite permease-like protein
MKTAVMGIFTFLILLFLATTVSAGEVDGDRIIITGHIKDLHNVSVGEAELAVLVNGEVYKANNEEYLTKSATEGFYNAEIELEKGLIETSKISLEVSKPTYKTERIEIRDFCKRDNNEYLASKDIILIRTTNPAFWISAAVLASIYILIAFEIFHRTLAALLGAVIVLVISYTLGTFDSDYFIISFENAVGYIDINVIGLLMGMMIIVGLMKPTGVFQWMAFKSYQLVKGRVWLLAVVLCCLSAFVSMWLDNVTTMILIIPVVLEISRTLDTTPLNFLVPMWIASNFGGTATLIGDPPNIMIGSYSGLDFNTFIWVLTPFVWISMIPMLGMVYFYWRKEYRKIVVEDIDGLIEKLRVEYRITDFKLLTYSLSVLAFVILLFFLGGILHMQVSVAALTGAVLLLVISRADVVKILMNEVEWPTLIFFVGLFVVVGGTVETGLIEMIAKIVADQSGGNLTIAVLLVLWISAISSAFIDNIPFTATMLPIVAYLSQVLPGAESNVLWWALSIGACYGGNGTLIGASANVVTAGICEREGYPISFNEYLKVGWPIMMVSVIMGMIFLLVRFWVL